MIKIQKLKFRSKTSSSSCYFEVSGCLGVRYKITFYDFVVCEGVVEKYNYINLSQKRLIEKRFITISREKYLSKLKDGERIHLL